MISTRPSNHQAPGLQTRVRAASTARAALPWLPLLFLLTLAVGAARAQRPPPTPKLTSGSSNQSQAGSGGQDQSSSGSSDAASANDPSSPLIKLEQQEWYSPSLDGRNSHNKQENQFLFRNIFPIPAFGGLPNQLARVELRINTAPDGTTGLGDTDGYYTFFLVSQPKLRVSLGGTYVLPTATYHEVGAGKWQLGPALTASYSQIPNLLLVAIVQNPISFAGSRDARSVNALSLQPLLIGELPKGFFVRVDPIMNFDWERGGAATIPINIGFGRTFKVGRQLVNAYVQPEWNVVRPGDDRNVPRFTLRFAFGFYFPEKKK